MSCKEAVIEAVKKLGNIVSTKDVISWINKKYPNKWKTVTIRCHLIGLSVNHPSSKHYPTLHRQACLFYLGDGRYKFYDPEKDNNERDIENKSPSDEYFEASISLERDLEEHIVRDLNQIENSLKLYLREGITGRQFNTEVGRIDILAIDKKGDFVVIELKAGTTNDSVIGQILGYISWIKQNIAQGKTVRGIIIADDFDKRVRYSSSELPNISLKKYEITFTFKDAQRR